MWSFLYDAPPDGALAALSAYRNPDGGYGWGLEADLRARESQPGAALHAFEVFEASSRRRARKRSSSATGWRECPCPTAGSRSRSR